MKIGFNETLYKCFTKTRSNITGQFVRFFRDVIQRHKEQEVGKRVVLMQKQDNCNTLHRLHVEPSSDTSALSSIITFFGGKVL